MKHLVHRLLLAVFLLAFASEAAAQVDELRNEPGYLNLQDLGDWFEEEPWLEVNIRGALLSLVAEASRYEDPELTGLLRKLKAIEVRGYPLSGERYEDVERRTSALSSRLRSQGWETVARVREREERVDMYLKIHEGSIAGLVVMVLEPNSDDGAVFVNIVGEISPEEIGRIGSKFNINPLKESMVKQ